MQRLRAFFPVLAGIIASMLMIGLIESLQHYMYPEFVIDPEMSKEKMKEAIQQLPIGAILMIALAWVVGSFVGCGLITALDKSASIWRAMIPGFLTLFGCIINFFAIPHPLWFVLLSFPAVAIAAYLGQLVGRGISIGKAKG